MFEAVIYSRCDPSTESALAGGFEDSKVPERRKDITKQIMKGRPDWRDRNKLKELYTEHRNAGFDVPKSRKGKANPTWDDLLQDLDTKTKLSERCKRINDTLRRETYPPKKPTN